MVSSMENVKLLFAIIGGKSRFNAQVPARSNGQLARPAPEANPLTWLPEANSQEILQAYGTKELMESSLGSATGRPVFLAARS